MAEQSGRLIRASAQWTPEQYGWLQRESQRLGLASVSAVARLIVQTAMAASGAACLNCPQHCTHNEVTQ